MSCQYPVIVSSRLEAVRDERGLKRPTVARQLGISTKQLERWEKGTSPVKRVHLLALAAIYDVPVEELEGVAA